MRSPIEVNVMEELRAQAHEALDRAIDNAIKDEAELATSRLPVEIFDQRDGSVVGGAAVTVAYGRGGNLLLKALERLIDEGETDASIIHKD